MQYAMCLCVLGTLAVRIMYTLKLPATSKATNPRQHRPKDLSKPRRDIHLVKIKYCEDTGPQNQLNAAKEYYKDLCNILQGSLRYSPHHSLGVGHLQHTLHTLKPFKELGLDSQKD